MRRFPAVVLAALVAVPGPAMAQSPSGGGADLLAIGQRIYRQGILPSGEPLRGVGEAGVTFSGAEAACETCHRRSGYGSSEGPIEVRAITGPALFGERVAPVAPGVLSDPVAMADDAALSPAEAARARARLLRSVRAAQFAGRRQRLAYDDASLARAIRDGVDASGRPMNASMPRYALDDAAAEALTAYLKALSATVSPGVTDDTVHFATVIQPGTDPAQRRALLDVLQTFVRDRNRGLLDQVRREMGGSRRLGRSYREWVLHVWDLSGPSETWGRQLEAYYAAQPVFALMSGIGHASWRPIHEFSERFEVPGIFPQTEVPVLGTRDFYTVYLSRGIALEAQALAKFLHDQAERGPVIQVSDRSEASAAGAAAFRDAWTAAAGAAPEELVLDGKRDPGFWEQLARRADGATLVLWLAASAVAHAQPLAAPPSKVKAIYLSASLNAGQRTGLAADAEGRVRLVYPQDPPAARAARLEVVKRWLHSNGIAPGDETVQMNAYLAATVTGMLVTHSKDTYSREFLLERMEHRLGTALELSIYPHLSLGPGQRYASKGSYIVAVRGADDRQLAPVSDWIVP